MGEGQTLMNSSAFAADTNLVNSARTSTASGYIVAENNIIETIAASEQHSDLTYAIGRTDLVETLVYDGPYTVLAPLDTAFDEINPDYAADLMIGDKTSDLTQILQTHVIEGKLDLFTMKANIEASNAGQVSLKTINGASLTAMISNDDIMLYDSQGNSGKIVTPDLKQTNGIIHVIDTVLMPN